MRENPWFNFSTPVRSYQRMSGVKLGGIKAKERFISYIPCLRVALAEVARDCLDVP